jgi:hypothetical protein
VIGFKPLPAQRKAVRNEQGEKIGYLASLNGAQAFTDVSGKVIATNIRFKQSPPGRTGAQGGSFAPPDNY